MGERGYGGGGRGSIRLSDLSLLGAVTTRMTPAFGSDESHFNVQPSPFTKQQLS